MDGPIVWREVTANTLLVPASRLFELLASSGLQHILHSNGWATNPAEDEEDEDDSDETEYDHSLNRLRNQLRRRRTGQQSQLKPPKIPSDAGTELMSEGHFGTDQYYIDRLKKRKMAFATNLMWRELGVDSYGVRRRADQAISQVSRATDRTRVRI